MNFFKSIKIKRITRFSLRYSVGYAMYAYEIFELENKDGRYFAKIKLRGIPDEQATTIEVDAEFDQKLEEIIKEFNIQNWDGFNKSNKMVLDGDSFSLYILMEEDNSISANGYMKWPKKYKEFKEKIVELFNQVMKPNN